MAPLSIALANDNWTLSLSCDAYNRGETDALLAPLASEAWVSNEILTALTAYSTTVQVGTAISDALGAYSSTAEMNTAISDAIDALNVAQYQDAAGVQFLIDQALLAYWMQAEVSSFVAGGGRAGQLRHQRLRQLQHLVGPQLLRRLRAGGLEDRHGPAGLLHEGRSRPGHR